MHATTRTRKAPSHLGTEHQETVVVQTPWSSYHWWGNLLHEQRIVLTFPQESSSISVSERGDKPNIEFLQRWLRCLPNYSIDTSQAKPRRMGLGLRSIEGSIGL